MATDISANAGPSIRERRLAAGLTQEVLARRARCSLSMLRLIEHGYAPSSRMCQRLDKALTRAAEARREEVNA